MWASLIRTAASTVPAIRHPPVAASASSYSALGHNPLPHGTYAVTYVPPLQRTRSLTRRGDRGLFDGKRVLTGNNVPDSKHRTRRTWKPNVQKVALYSESLGQVISLRCTVRVMRKLDQFGGLDRYLLVANREQLGGLGLRLRSLVIAAIKVKAQLTQGFTLPHYPPELAYLIPQWQDPKHRVLGTKGSSLKMIENSNVKEPVVGLVQDGQQPEMDKSLWKRRSAVSTHPRRRLQ